MGSFFDAIPLLRESISREFGDKNYLAERSFFIGLSLLEEYDKPHDALFFFLTAYSRAERKRSKLKELAGKYFEKIRNQIGEARYQTLLEDWKAKDEG